MSWVSIIAISISTYSIGLSLISIAYTTRWPLVAEARVRLYRLARDRLIERGTSDNVVVDAFTMVDEMMPSRTWWKAWVSVRKAEAAATARILEDCKVVR